MHRKIFLRARSTKVKLFIPHTKIKKIIMSTGYNRYLAIKNSSANAATKRRIAANYTAALIRREQRFARNRNMGYPTRPVAGITGTGLFNARARGVEKKYIDTTATVTTLLTTPTITLLNSSQTGTDYTNRIGREIKMSSNYLRWNASASSNGHLRVMIIYDKQPNGSFPALSDLVVTGLANYSISPNNLNNKDRFITISDKVYTFNTASNPNYFVKKYKKLATNTTYSGTTTGIGSLATGALYLVLMATTDTISFNYNNRVRFVDL